jgi:hypothetical protein
LFSNDHRCLFADLYNTITFVCQLDSVWDSFPTLLVHVWAELEDLMW